MKKTGLFNRYPGATDPLLCDGSDCASIVEPFGGSCAVSISYGFKVCYWADHDNSVRAVMDLYASGSYSLQSNAIKEIKEWQQQLTEDSRQWTVLLNEIEDFQQNEYSTEALSFHVANSLVFRALAYAGILRTGKSSDRINVTMGKDQYQNLKCKAPMPLVKKANTNIQVFGDWTDCLMALPESANAICVLDPPYYGDMEPCYYKHRPKELSTLNLFKDSLQVAASHPGVKRILAKNYFCNETELAVQELGLQYVRVNRGTMGRIRPNKPVKENLECFWTIYKDMRDVQRQLSLLNYPNYPP